MTYQGKAAAPVDDQGKDPASEIVEKIAEPNAAEAEAAAPEPEEVVLEVDGKELPQPTADENSVIRNFRAQHRESSGRIQNLEYQLKQALEGAQNNDDASGNDLPPDPEADEYAYDPAKYGEALVAYDRAQQAKKSAEALAVREVKAANDKVDAQRARYQDQLAKIGFKGAKEAEDNVRAALSDEQQRAILDSDKSAAIVCALGSDEAKLKAFSEITNQKQLWRMIGSLEASVQVKKRAPLAPPENIPEGLSGGAAGHGKALEKLREEARKTGDYTSVSAYRRKIKRMNV